MNPLDNMLVVLEKELEWERQGNRRTRRYIGDNRQVIDARWYQAQQIRIEEPGFSPAEENLAAQIESRQQAHSTIFSRLLHLPRTRHQPACNEC